MKAWHVVALVAGGSALAPLFGACYTYNIIEYHDGPGGGGAGGSTSSDTGMSTTATADTTTVTSSTGSGLNLCATDSKGFELFSGGGNCGLTASTSLTTAVAQNSCWYWRANEPAPAFDPGDGNPANGSVVIDTGCSEVTPFGLGPVFYKTIQNDALATTDFAIWGTFEFEYGPESPYNGAGLLMRSTTLQNHAPYAIMDVYEHDLGTANVAIWAHDASNMFAQPYGNSVTFSGGFDGRIALCYRAMENKIHGFEQRMGTFQELNASYTPNFGSDDVLLGFAAHAYGDDMNPGGRVTIRVRNAGWGVRAASTNPCPGDAGFMPGG